MTQESLCDANGRCTARGDNEQSACRHYEQMLGPDGEELCANYSAGECHSIAILERLDQAKALETR